MNSVVLRRSIAPAIAISAVGSTFAVVPASAASASASSSVQAASVQSSTAAAMRQTSTVRPVAATPAASKRVARVLVAQRRWSGVQFTCLDRLWMKESRWNHRAMNRSSGAYGIPQALPGRKMASAGADWRTNPATQIRWGLSYIKQRYGSPCQAWSHSQRRGWY